MPTSRGLSAGSSDVARFLDTAHKTRDVEIFENKARYVEIFESKARYVEIFESKARYVEIFESQVLKTAKSVRHESAIILAAERAVEKVLTQHISYLALGMLQ